jgi:arabinose-5-phosphate isomerase
MSGTDQRDISPLTRERDRDSETAFIAEALRAEADAIIRIAERISDGEANDCRRAVDLLAACEGHVVVSGMGKSGLVGAKISATFCSLGQPSSVLHPAEAVHGDLGRIRRGDVVMLLSYSGETEEVVNLAAILQADNVPRLGISSNPNSALARLSNVHLSLGDVIEACPLNLAPTASTTAMLALGDALALAVSRRRNFDEDDFHKHHPGGMLGVGLRKVTEILRFRVGENTTAIPGHLTVREACLLARRAAKNQRRAGALLIVDDDGRLAGIFTDGDLRRLVVDEADAMNRRISEVMTARPQHLTIDDLVRDAQRVVRERRVDEIPVLDHEGRPVGLIDVQDLIAMKVVSE